MRVTSPEKAELDDTVTLFEGKNTCFYSTPDKKSANRKKIADF
jgi:hypothetical protein